MRTYNLDQSFLKIIGIDARRYLNGMFSSDVKSLKAGYVQSYLLLSPQGKIISFGQLLCINDEQFVFSTPSSVSEQVFQALDRYLIADDAKIQKCDQFQSSTLVVKNSSTTFSQEYLNSTPVLMDSDNCFDFHCGVSSLAICWNKQIVENDANAFSADEFKDWRVRSGLAFWGYDFKSESMCIELPLSFAVSFTKGCYMGQEVVAKGTIRGKPPRYLVSIKKTGEDLKLLDAEGKQVGEISSSSGEFALGFLRRHIIENKTDVFLDSKPIEYKQLTFWA